MCNFAECKPRGMTDEVGPSNPRQIAEVRPSPGKPSNSGRPREPTLVILAHADPGHLRRLIDVCSTQPVILHCDSKTPEILFRQMIADLPERVIIAPRSDTRLASWSLVRAELQCIKIALDKTQGDHIVVMSGSDYPLVAPSAIGPHIAGLGDRSWFWNVDLPFSPWSVLGFPDGGLWRLRHRFMSRRGQQLWLGKKPLFNPIRRRIHPDLQPRASSQWKILSRSDAQSLISVLYARPDLVAFGSSTFTPDESFVASVLGSHSLWGPNALQQCFHSPWLTNWHGSISQHPKWFTEADIPRIRRHLLAMAEASNPDIMHLPNNGMPLFGRKFTSRFDPHLLDSLEKAFW